MKGAIIQEADIINNNQALNNMDSNNSSGTNTTLLVIILLIIVGVGVWWFTMRSAPADDGIKVDINFPGGDESAQ